MTNRELSQLYYIKKFIDRDREQLALISSRLEPGGSNLSNDMPHSATPKNIVDELLPQLVDLETRLKRELEEFDREQKRIEEYISTIKDDYQMRLILTYRYIDLLTWQQVATKIGGRNTEDSVKKSCYRFLRKSEKSKVVPNVPK